MKNLKTSFRLLTIQVKYSGFASELLSFGLMSLAILLLPVSRVRAAKLLMLAHRNTFHMKRQIFREKILERFNLYAPDIIDRLVPPIEDLPEDTFHKRILKLKEPSEDEKGVIICKFLDTFNRLRAEYDMDRILQEYFLVLEMSYYGCCRAETLQYLQYAPRQITVGAVQELEHAYLTRLKRNLVPADFSSSTWIDDRMYVPHKYEKEYDCIMVGTWHPIKRHHMLLKAIKKLNDPTYRALLIGSPWGGTMDQVQDLVEHYGVGHNVDVKERLPQPEVNVLLSKAKVIALFSLKEGGNKSVIEGMLTDVPVLLLREHIGIKREWVNEKTGRLCDEHELPEVLQWFRTNYTQFAPREWALNNISCRISTAKLEQSLKETSERLGEPWTRSLKTKVNHGWKPDYFYEDDPLSPFDFEKYRK